MQTPLQHRSGFGRVFVTRAAKLIREATVAQTTAAVASDDELATEEREAAAERLLNVTADALARVLERLYNHPCLVLGGAPCGRGGHAKPTPTFASHAWASHRRLRGRRTEKREL